MVKDIEVASLEEGLETEKSPTGTSPPNRREATQLHLDTGDERVTFRRSWWQLWYTFLAVFSASRILMGLDTRLPKDPPPPAPASLSDAPVRGIYTYCQVQVLSVTIGAPRCYSFYSFYAFVCLDNTHYGL